MARADDLATEDEVREALADLARQGHLPAQEEEQRQLKPGEHPFPDPPPDWLIIRLEKPFRRLQMKSREASSFVDRDAFDREIRESFAEVGVVVDVKWWDTNIPGVYLPEVEPYALLFKPDDDPDRQVHDVVNDTLGLGAGGVIEGDAGFLK